MRSHYQDQKTIVDQLQHELKMKSNEVSVYESKTVGYEQQIRSLRCELDEERAIAESLRANQALWTQQAQKWEEERQIWKRERNDLEEQVRDLMIFLDARNKIETMATEEERNEATVHVGPSSTSKTRGKRRHGKK
jgi:BRCA1-associated protein